MSEVKLQIFFVLQDDLTISLPNHTSTTNCRTFTWHYITTILCVTGIVIMRLYDVLTQLIEVKSWRFRGSSTLDMLRAQNELLSNRHLGSGSENGN